MTYFSNCDRIKRYYLVMKLLSCPDFPILNFQDKKKKHYLKIYTFYPMNFAFPMLRNPCTMKFNTSLY